MDVFSMVLHCHYNPIQGCSDELVVFSLVVLGKFFFSPIAE